MSDSSAAPPHSKSRRSRRGCWLTALGSLALLAGALYYIIYYTAIPARFFVSQATEEDTFEAEDVGGSIASGTSTIGVMRFDTGGKSMSEFYGFKMKFPGSGMFEDGKIVIESISYDRVVLHLDSRNLAPKPKPKEEEKSPEKSAEKKKANEGFRMKKLAIPVVTVHVEDLGWNLEFAAGLTVGEVAASESSMEFGGLTLSGDTIRIVVPPFAATTADKESPFVVTASITLFPALDPTTVAKDIDLLLTQIFLHEKPHATEITAFDSRFKTGTVPAAENRWFLHAENLTISDHVTGWFPGTDLSIEATYDSALGQFHSLTSGSFTLDNQHYTLTPFDNQPTNTLRATSASGTTLTLTFANGFSAPLLSPTP